jgi:hypothetical protein
VLKTRTGANLSLLLADLLAGAWRDTPPAPELFLAEETAEDTTELSTVAPLLIASGGGALAFWKLRETALKETAVAEDFKQTYRLNTLQSVIHEREIEQVVRLLQQAGVEPILVKGWSIARLYPEQALRPYGDIDLFVRPEQFAAAADVLQSEEGRKFFVDLHRGASHLDTEPLEDLYARSQVVKLKDVSFRVLAPEDHLRVLCVHYLHHGAWRPAGLCDIGLMVESFGRGMDWDICLTKNRKRAGWIACTIGLAHQLLRADLSGLPAELQTKQLPGWLVPAVLKEWENPVAVQHVVPPPLAQKLGHPLETIKAIRRRWPPNPIQATIVMNGSFNEWPRIIFQAGNYAARTAKFLKSLPGKIRK